MPNLLIFSKFLLGGSSFKQDYAKPDKAETL
jgi:hypothetical protein